MHGTRDANGSTIGLRRAIRRAAGKSSGMLAAALFPAIVLALGTTDLLSDQVSIWAALWVCVVALGCLGYLTYRRKGAPLHMRLLGALSTASFGFVIIVAKAIITH